MPGSPPPAQTRGSSSSLARDPGGSSSVWSVPEPRRLQQLQRVSGGRPQREQGAGRAREVNGSPRHRPSCSARPRSAREQQRVSAASAHAGLSLPPDLRMPRAERHKTLLQLRGRLPGPRTSRAEPQGPVRVRSPAPPPTPSRTSLPLPAESGTTSFRLLRGVLPPSPAQAFHSPVQEASPSAPSAYVTGQQGVVITFYPLLRHCEVTLLLWGQGMSVWGDCSRRGIMVGEVFG
ncbi:uncharacterized protein LOC128823093 [Malaclemys terrapin pileata]|uniref:uncharacterized protein LOC128823093 n=1 Tax=Malaclemys terrapin pileata TaxID=2991368 RepID=UPI0023A84032|nr:uncharacterized protein LOC128823093 [Malaclemys terrapin pileata]